jgi:hypothetical protein
LTYWISQKTFDPSDPFVELITKETPAVTVPTDRNPQLEQLWSVINTAYPVPPLDARVPMVFVFTVAVPDERVATPQLPDMCGQIPGPADA